MNWFSPARPEPNWPQRSREVISQSVQKGANLKFDYYVDTDLKNFSPNVEWKISFNFEIIEFFVISVFCLFSIFFAYSSEATYYFQNLIVSHERTLQPLPESIKFLIGNQFL